MNHFLKDKGRGGLIILTANLWLNDEGRRLTWPKAYRRRFRQPPYNSCLTTDHTLDLGIDFTEGGKPEGGNPEGGNPEKPN